MAHQCYISCTAAVSCIRDLNLNHSLKSNASTGQQVAFGIAFLSAGFASWILTCILIMNEVYLKRLNKACLAHVCFTMNHPPLHAVQLQTGAFSFLHRGRFTIREKSISSIILLTSQSHDYTLKPVKRSHYSRTHAGSMLQIPLIPPKPHKRLKLKWDHRHVSACAWRVTQLLSPFWWLHQLPEVLPKAASIVSGAWNRFGEINDHEEHLVSLLTLI